MTDESEESLITNKLLQSSFQPSIIHALSRWGHRQNVIISLVVHLVEIDNLCQDAD